MKTQIGRSEKSDSIPANPPTRGENPASIATHQNGEPGGDAESKTQNPAEVARVNGARGDKLDGSELRKELGVIVYTFDKKEQVQRRLHKLPQI